MALGALTALAVYNAIAARKRDRLEATNQLANLARGSDDLARQLAEFGRRLGAVEVKVDTVVDRALATAQPLAAEIEELSALVKQLADSVAAQETAINNTALAVERRSLHAPVAPPAHCARSPRRRRPPPVAAAPRSLRLRSRRLRCKPRRHRRRRRSSARFRLSPAWTATASLPRSAAPSTAAGSISSCSPS